MIFIYCISTVSGESQIKINKFFIHLSDKRRIFTTKVINPPLNKNSMYLLTDNPLIIKLYYSKLLSS